MFEQLRPEEKEAQEHSTIIDRLHAEISKGIQGTATWMDSFFGDRRYQSELNKSYIRIRSTIFMERGSPTTINPDLHMRLVLPQLREKTKLVLSDDREERQDLSGIDSEPPKEFSPDREQRNVSAAVHQTFRETASDSFILRAGLHFRGGRPSPMLGTRYRILFPLSIWHFRFIEDVTWRSETGLESRTTADLERQLPNGLFFRATHEWLLTETADGFLYALKFHLGQPLSQRRALEYEWLNIFHTRPVNELVEVVFRARYRQRIWRDWLYFEASPQCRFPRNLSFDPTLGILFRLELVLGNYT